MNNGLCYLVAYSAVFCRVPFLTYYTAKGTNIEADVRFSCLSNPTPSYIDFTRCNNRPLHTYLHTHIKKAKIGNTYQTKVYE